MPATHWPISPHPSNFLALSACFLALIFAALAFFGLTWAAGAPPFEPGGYSLDDAGKNVKCSPGTDQWCLDAGTVPQDLAPYFTIAA